MLSSSIVNQIHQMEPENHIVIGTILRKFPHVKLNENKNGIMVNVSTLPEDACTEILQYLDYLQKQQSILNKIEKETHDCKQYVSNEPV